MKSSELKTVSLGRIARENLVTLKIMQSSITVIYNLIFRKNQAAWQAQLGERRSAEREVAGSNPGRTNTKGL